VTIRTNADTPAAVAGGVSVNLETALRRIADLDDEELEDLVHDLDSALAECRGCLAGDTDMNLVSVAASARIALRRRRASAARFRAIHRVHQLISTETIA
jgi:hypothetical protein